MDNMYRRAVVLLPVIEVSGLPPEHTHVQVQYLFLVHNCSFGGLFVVPVTVFSLWNGSANLQRILQVLKEWSYEVRLSSHENTL